MQNTREEYTYDFRNPEQTFVENGILKSHLPDMLHRNVCHHCNIKNIILLNNQDYLKWTAGHYSQDVFTWLSTDDREILQTGIHPDCWNEMFPEE